MKYFSLFSVLRKINLLLLCTKTKMCPTEVRISFFLHHVDASRALPCSSSHEVHHHDPGFVGGHEAEEEVLLELVQLLPEALLVLAQLPQHLLHQPPLPAGARRRPVLHAQPQQRHHVFPLVAHPRHQPADRLHVPVEYVRALRRGLQLHQRPPRRPPGEEPLP
uniref:Uncharacterized protein n=1 Tax=Oryza rufipogon TaxID=4529 RepID=A0A0E0NPP9_ORYRU